jgi:hypothetical protein
VTDRAAATVESCVEHPLGDSPDVQDEEAKTPPVYETMNLIQIAPTFILRDPNSAIPCSDEASTRHITSLSPRRVHIFSAFTAVGKTGEEWGL